MTLPEEKIELNFKTFTSDVKFSNEQSQFDFF